MLIGLVLAGGQARRMGEDKALMKYKGNTLINHTSALLEQAGCEQIFISRNTPGFINDVIENGGPLAGLHALMRMLHHRAEKGTMVDVVVMPVDMPLMSPKFLQSMVNYGREHKRPCYVEERFLPFYLPVESSHFSALEQYLVVENRRRVVGFLQRIDALTYQEAIASKNDSAQWLNVNTPDDWPNETQ